MKRLTEKYSPWPCRIPITECGEIEEWIDNLCNESWAFDKMCDNCPIKKYINRLAELEDLFEEHEELLNEKP